MTPSNPSWFSNRPISMKPNPFRYIPTERSRALTGRAIRSWVGMTGIGRAVYLLIELHRGDARTIYYWMQTSISWRRPNFPFLLTLLPQPFLNLLLSPTVAKIATG